MKEARELDGATFRPDLSPSRQRAGESFAVSVSSLCFQTAHSSHWSLHLYGMMPGL